MKLKKLTLIFTIFIIVINLLRPASFAVTSTESDIQIYSDGAVLMESSTGKLLYGKNENKKLYPASTTKILTAIIAIEKYNLTDTLTASKNAVMSIPSGYSNAAIQPDEALKVQDLLELFLIHSANEIGYIFAENISGNVDKFADLMNQKASEIGCKNTHFVNPNGVHDDNHYSTAYDLSLIAKEAMKNDIFRQIVSTASYTLPNSNKYSRIDRTLITTNDLIKKQSNNYYEYAIGIKTGFTTPAKNCLVSSATKDGKTLIAVVLRSNTDNNRYNDTKTLFNYGFDNFSKKDIVKSGSTIKTIDVKNATSATKNLNLVAETGINTMVTNDKLNDTIEPQINLNEHLQAPIKKDSIVGTATYTVDNIKYTINLKAGNEVKKSYTLYLVIAIAIIALLLIIFEKPNKKKKRQTTRRPVKKSGYHKAR